MLNIEMLREEIKNSVPKKEKVLDILEIWKDILPERAINKKQAIQLEDLLKTFESFTLPSGDTLEERVDRIVKDVKLISDNIDKIYPL